MLVAVVIVGSLIAAPGANARGPRSVLVAPPIAESSQLRGVNITANWFALPYGTVDRELRLALALGARIIRLPMPWALVQPTGPSDDPGFLAASRHLLGAARREHLRVVVEIGGTSCWDTSVPDPGHETDPCYSGWLSGSEGLYVPRDLSQFAGYAADLARRFGSEIYAEEIWNEPNNPAFMRATPAQYVSVLGAAYRAVRRTDHNMIIVAGNLALSDAQWLDAAYAAGLGGHFDAISVHPYDVRFTGPDEGFGDPAKIWTGAGRQGSFRSGPPSVRAVMRRHDDS
ncbi:MAG: cellulase family glycosylhydrolase, partial [Actinomycetota bacterium]|nr:cellulase family glycosylhydrolase [Actinomycetota bacterium]